LISSTSTRSPELDRTGQNCGKRYTNHSVQLTSCTARHKLPRPARVALAPGLGGRAPETIVGDALLPLGSTWYRNSLTRNSMQQRLLCSFRKAWKRRKEQNKPSGRSCFHIPRLLQRLVRSLDLFCQRVAEQPQQSGDRPVLFTMFANDGPGWKVAGLSTRGGGGTPPYAGANPGSCQVVAGTYPITLRSSIA